MSLQGDALRMLEIAIVGGGPAGLTAGLYARRAGCSCALFEVGFPGGQQATTDRVENYPGFPGGVGGPELSAAMQAQAEAFGLEIRYEAVERVELDGPIKRLYGPGGVTEARAVILAMGATPKALGVPGEEAFRGRGVSYCATCDGAFYRGKDVAVVGGGDTAAEDALYLSRFAKTVTLLHRRDKLRALCSLAERLEQTSNVKIIYNAQTLSIEGENAVTGLTYRDKMSGEDAPRERRVRGRGDPARQRPCPGPARHG